MYLYLTSQPGAVLASKVYVGDVFQCLPSVLGNVSNLLCDFWQNLLFPNLENGNNDI